jgi:hypothetical protein
MNELSKEAKELIEESANSFGNLRIRHGFKLGAEIALTTPVLLEKQGLISLEDAMGFAEWLADNYQWIPLKKKFVHDDDYDANELEPSSKLFQIYKQQK